MKSLFKPIFGIMLISAFLIGCSNPLTFDKAMMTAASELNESCPMMVDQETRLDNAVALPDNVFQYNYTLVNFTKEELDLEEFTAHMEPQITNNVKTNPDLKIYRDNQVTMKYYYKDKNGVFVAQFAVTYEDYK